MRSWFARLFTPSPAEKPIKPPEEMKLPRDPFSVLESPTELKPYDAEALKNLTTENPHDIEDHFDEEEDTQTTPRTLSPINLVPMGKGENKELDETEDEPLTTESSEEAFDQPQKEEKYNDEDLRSNHPSIHQGIKNIIDYCQKQGNIIYDAQGIATIQLNATAITHFSPDFPNRLANGLTVHFFNANYIHHPPVQYMIHERIKSYYRAAKALYKIEDIKNALQEVTQQIIDQFFLEFKQKSFPTLEAQSIAFHQMAIQLTDITTGYLLDELYKQAKTKNPSLVKEHFIEHLIKAAGKKRSSEEDILTFNEEDHAYSYDGMAYFSKDDTVKQTAFVTAHDKQIGNRIANLSMIVDGTTDDPTAHLFSLKHATLAPDRQLAVYRIQDPWESDLHCLMQTCQNAEDVMLAHACIKQYEPNHEEPLQVDWVYQLLTTNAWNDNKQAINYGYMVKAARLMHGQTFQVNNTTVQASMHIFNAGISEWAEWNVFQKKDTQRVENRKTYVHMTDRLHILVSGTDIPPLDALATLFFPDNTAYGEGSMFYMQYHEAQLALTTNANQFKKVRESYYNEYLPLAHEVKDLQNRLKQNPHDKAEMSEALHLKQTQMKLKLAKISADTKACLKVAQRLQKEIRNSTYRIETLTVAQWKKHRKTIREKIAEIKSDPSKIKDLNDLDRRRLTAFIYKCYMDELYYTNQYRKPKYAALFNTYLLGFQRAIGTDSSIGCMSSNDRTLILHELGTALTSPVPESYHREEDQSLFSRLMTQLRKRIWRNSGVISCINDNLGTPKVDDRHYPFTKATVNDHEHLSFLTTFGNYATHKIKLLLNHIMKIYTLFRGNHQALFPTAAPEIPLNTLTVKPSSSHFFTPPSNPESPDYPPEHKAKISPPSPSPSRRRSGPF